MTLTFSLEPRLETVAASIRDISEMAYERAWKWTQRQSPHQTTIDNCTQVIWRLAQTAKVHGVKEAQRQYWSSFADVSIGEDSSTHGKCIVLMLEPWPGTRVHEAVTCTREVAEVVIELGIARCITLEQRKLIDDLKAKAEADGVKFVLPELDWEDGVFEQPVAETHNCIVVVLEPWPGVRLHEIVRLCEADAREVIKNGWARQVTLEQADVLMAQHETYTRPRPRFHGELRNGCLIHRAGKRVKAG